MPSPLDQQLNFSLGGPPGSDAASVAASVFGKDVMFNEEAVLAPKGDYLTVEGIDNLRRAVWRRLIVRPGEYRLKPHYGVGILTYVKKPITRATIDELTHRIRDNLSRERRIEKVLTVQVVSTFFGTHPGIIVTVQVRAIGRDVTFQPFNFSSEVQ